MIAMSQPAPDSHDVPGSNPVRSQAGSHWRSDAVRHDFLAGGVRSGTAP